MLSLQETEKVREFYADFEKIGAAVHSRAGGVMVFRVGCDKLMDDPNSVACGIENALHRYVENW